MKNKLLILMATVAICVASPVMAMEIAEVKDEHSGASGVPIKLLKDLTVEELREKLEALNVQWKKESIPMSEEREAAFLKKKEIEDEIKELEATYEQLTPKDDTNSPFAEGSPGFISFLPPSVSLQQPQMEDIQSKIKALRHELGNRRKNYATIPHEMHEVETTYIAKGGFVSKVNSQGDMTILTSHQIEADGEDFAGFTFSYYSQVFQKIIGFRS